MAKLSRKKGITSQILHIFIQDSSSTTGAGLAGLVYNTASLACRYINAGGTLSGAITLQDITTLGTYEAPTANTNMRFKEVSSASPSQGVYEIHLHNDWMNLTGGSLVIMMAGATNMAQFRLEIDLQADVNVTHVAGTAQTAGDLKNDLNTLLTRIPTLVKADMETVINAYEPAKISVSGRLFDVSANGNVGIDWNNIDTPGATQNLSATTMSAVSGAVGSVTGNVGGDVLGSVAALGVNAINNNSIHSNACAKISDSGIQRGASNWENNADNRSLAWAISKLVNKVDLNAAGDTLTIRKSNDSTALFTQAVTTSGGASPITALDTA